MLERATYIGFKTREVLKKAALDEAKRQNRSLSNLCEIALGFYLEHGVIDTAKREKTA